MPQPLVPFPSELQLIVKGARLHLSEKAADELRALVQRGLNWNLVADLGQHHQVLALVLHNLRTIKVDYPKTVDTSFKRYARRVALQNMLLVEQLKVIQGLFEEAEIPVIHFKGPVLSEQAYKSLALRACSDLDMLVRPEDLGRVGGIVTGNGFMPGSKLQLWYGLKRKIFLYLSQQATFVHRGNHIHLDVHVGLAPPLYAYPTNFEVLYERGVDVSIGKCALRTFCPEDALVLLCLHGEKNRWEFLKYVTDISATVEGNPELDWDLVERIARDTHTQRIVRLGLLLAVGLISAPVPAEVVARLEKDSVIAELRDAVVGRMSSMNMQITDFEKRFWLHLRTQDSLRDRLRYLGVATLRWAWDHWDGHGRMAPTAQ